MGQVYMTRLQSVNRDTFQCYKDMRTNFRKFKTQQRRNQKWLQECSDLLACWQAVAEVSNKTVSYTNELKMQSQRRYNELLTKKDEIIAQYRDGIASLKRIELHAALRDPSKKQVHLIDIYYNEKSMDQFRNSLLQQLKDFAPKLALNEPVGVPDSLFINSSSIQQSYEQLKAAQDDEGQLT